jgi:hypothetical protein
VDLSEFAVQTALRWQLALHITAKVALPKNAAIKIPLW